MKSKVKVEICACTRCSMVGSMEIGQNVSDLQFFLDEEGLPKYDIELTYVCRSDLNEAGYKSPVAIVNDQIFGNADTATVLEAVINASNQP